MTITTLCTTNIIRPNSHNDIRKQEFGIKRKRNIKHILKHEKKKITTTNTATTCDVWFNLSIDLGLLQVRLSSRKWKLCKL